MFCINDTIACELLRFFYENDLRAPDDIAIICIEDTDLINSFANYLNMVIHDREEIGKESINLMHSILNGTVNSSRRVLIAPKCITKASFRREKSI
ncbi:MAG: LacI family transcriptional regulator [Clostridiales bacterium]|nr:LacI family transcriptional regulator [Clostridiales bacterium]